MRVSILTRPEGRVQPMRLVPIPARFRFQSSPVPKDGCNLRGLRAEALGEQFQSSPVPKDGCNEPDAHDKQRIRVSILTRPEGRVQLRLDVIEDIRRVFQSSPVPKDGCNNKTRGTRSRWHPVSILTRPEGRVQRSASSCEIRRCWMFQSSPVPKDGCNRHNGGRKHHEATFQSSPVPEDGCNEGLGGRRNLRR